MLTHKFIHSMKITDVHGCHNPISHEVSQEMWIGSQLKLIPPYPSLAHALVTGFYTALPTSGPHK